MWDRGAKDETFYSPEEARRWIEANPKRYVYKPFTPEGEEQDCDTTYVSESAEDLIRCLDNLFKESMGTPFLLQEVVEGEEISTEAYFDGDQFHLHNHTLEEKKFMAGGYGPNTGCSGNLIWTTNGANRLFSAGLGKTRDFLRDHSYRGMVDLNTIVNEHHVYGLSSRHDLATTPAPHCSPPSRQASATSFGLLLPGSRK